MFEKVTEFQNLNPNYVRQMVLEAMENGRPAADHRPWGVIFEDTTEFVKRQFANGREWVEFDWRFMDGRAYGVYTFHKNGTLYGAYRFV